MLPLMISLLVGLFATVATAVDLETVEWQTNETDPPIGDPAAKKGGTFRTWMTSYPLTFRIVGPDSNDSFAGWNRSQTTDFTLVRRHPTTDRHIPCLATHWKVLDDNKTVLYKLDPDARWSDSQPITADDFVFAKEMLESEFIVDPFWNNYMEENFSSVTALDEHTLQVVGRQESWRPLDDLNLFPLPRHRHELNENWIKEHNLAPAVGPGPYVITDQVEGHRVVFEKLEDWWGTDKRYFQGMYNVDRIEIRVAQDIDRAYDYFQKGDLDFYRVTSAKKWATGTDLDGIEKGWIHKKRLFVDYPQGMHGLAMNLTKPIFQNKDFRKAVQYAFDFDDLNENLMYSAYYRKVSAFEGTVYENPRLRPYGFNPKKCREHLTQAGYERRDESGFFVNGDGRRASFTLTYGSGAWTAFFTIMKQRFQSLGIEVKLSLIEPGTAFQRGLEREYELIHYSRTSNFFPGPHQYFHSEFLETTNNNNVWAFGNPQADEWIDIYRFDMDEARRIEAMHQLDAMIQDEAFYLPLFQAPYVRFVYWDHVGFPEFFWPKRFQQLTEWQIFWIDEEKKARLQEARGGGRSYEKDEVVDVDPYGIKEEVERAMRLVDEP